jgi:hypothetical protein
VADDFAGGSFADPGPVLLAVDRDSLKAAGTVLIKIKYLSSNSKGEK